MEFLKTTILNCKERILPIYKKDIQVDYKSDQSPVTEADLIINEMILETLTRFDASIPIISEETKNEQVTAPLFWLVDPLDGTKEFIQKNDQFTINVALIENGVPIDGIVYVPMMDEYYYTKDNKAYLNDNVITTRKAPLDGIVVASSRSHANNADMQDYLKNHTVKEIVYLGSSLKLCQVASGLVDMYPRLGTTMEWDIAAAQAILLKAGGVVQTLAGAPLGYGKLNYKNPHFVAVGDASIL